jgi:TP901 family phage tail tape measure protein
MWVVLKAQDLATHALNAFSRSVVAAGQSARTAQLEAERAAMRTTIAQRQAAEAALRNDIAQKQVAKSALQNTEAQMRLTGATADQIRYVKQMILDVDREIIVRERDLTVMEEQTVAMREQVAAMDEEIRKSRQSDAAMRDKSRSAGELSGKLKGVAQGAYAASFAITAAGIAGAVGLKKAVDAAVEYNREVSYTATQIDHFDGNLQKLGDIGIKVANQIAVPFDQLQPALYDIFSSIDVSVSQAGTMLRQFAKEAVAGQTTVQDAGRGTIAIMNGLHLPISDLNNVLDIQFELVKKGVGQFGDFAKVFGLIIPSAAKAGQNFQTVAAMLAFLTRNGLSASRAATSGARALDLFANPKFILNFSKLGGTVKDVHGNFLPLVDILGQLYDKTKQMGSVARAGFLKQLFTGAGGDIQAMRFITTALQPGQFEKFKGFLDDMAGASGQFEAAYGKMANTTAAKSQLLKNRWDAMKVSIGEALIPVFNKILDIIGKVVGWFNNLDPRIKNIISQFLAFATAAALVIGPLLGVIGIIASVASSLAALGLGLGEIIIIVVAVIAYIGELITIFTMAYAKSAAFRGIISDLIKTFRQIWIVIVGFVKDVKSAFDQHLKPALDNLWNVINTKVLPAVRQLAAAFESRMVKNLKEILNDLRAVADRGFKILSWVIDNLLIPAINRATDFYNKHKKGIDQVIAALQWFGKWVAIIAGGAVLGALLAIIIAIVGSIVIFINGITLIGEGFNKLKEVVQHAMESVYRIFVNAMADILGAADKAFGWIPGIGPKLHEAATKARQFADDFNYYLDQIHNKDVYINIKVAQDKVAKQALAAGYKIIPAFDKGGVVPGKIGEPTLAVVHGGEEVIPYEKRNSQSTGKQWEHHTTNNVTVNVSTNEINPQYHSAQLARLLAGRIG